MKLYYPITVDLYKVYPLPQMDAQQNNIGRGALITLTAAGTVVDPSDEDVKLYAKKPDGTISYLACVVDGGKVKVDFTSQMLILPGEVQVELVMISGNEQISTPIFIVNVRKSNYDSAAVESQNEFTALQQAVSNMNTVLQEVAELKENGLKGNPGAVYVPSVTDGVLSWTNDGGLENPEPVNITGPEGPQGPSGPASVVFAAYADFPSMGEAEKLYVDISNTDALVLYRWNGAKYVLSKGGVDLSLIAPEFDSETNYTAGQYVSYEEEIWLFTSDKEPGDWNESIVTSTTVAGELESLNSKTEWKLLGSATGADSDIDYSSIIGKYIELEVRVCVNVTSASKGVFTIPIRNFHGYHMTGYYYSSTNSASIVIHHTGTLIKLSSIWTKITDGTNNLSLDDAIVEVWYR